MSDKTLMIILVSINLVMWTCVFDCVRTLVRKNTELQKRTADYEQKCASYYHETFESMRKMTEINLSAMSHFIEQLSVNIMDKGTEHEKEDRE